MIRRSYRNIVKSRTTKESIGIANMSDEGVGGVLTRMFISLFI